MMPSSSSSGSAPTLSANPPQIASDANKLIDGQSEVQALLASTLQAAEAATPGIRGAATSAWSCLLDEWQAQASANKTQGEKLANGMADAARAYAAADGLNADELAQNDVHDPTALTGGESSVNPEATAALASGARTSTVTDSDLYGDSGEPSLDDVHQYGLGDCYFDSAMAAAAQADPDFIKNHIAYDPDTKSFAVTLYDWPYGRAWKDDGSNPAAAPITKTLTITQADIQADQRAQGVNSNTPGAPQWPAVMEAAYAKMEYGKVDTTSLRGIGSGASLDQGVATVTGKPGSLGLAPWAAGDGTGLYPNWHSGVPSAQQISAALANHQTVTVGTGPAPDGGGDREFEDGLAHSHAYTVTGVSTAANGDTMVTLRNPWGTNEGIPGDENTQGGYVTVDLDKESSENSKVIVDVDLGPQI